MREGKLTIIGYLGTLAGGFLILSSVTSYFISASDEPTPFLTVVLMFALGLAFSVPSFLWARRSK